MERAEVFNLDSGAAAVGDPRNELLTVESPTLQDKRTRTAIGRWMVVVWMGQMTFFVLVMIGGYLVAQKLDGQRDELEQQRTQNQALTTELAALTRGTEALRTDVVNLRQSLVTGSSEDVLFLKMLILKPSIDPTLARTIAGAIHRNSERYRRDPNLVLAIMAVESDFNPKAISRVGAEGLMQVMPHWKKVLGIDGELSDPEVSIRYGLQILGFYEEMYNDLNMALTAYNRGPGPVDTALMRGTSPNNGYAPKILQTYERLKRLNINAAGT